jgi:Flp pilus assembly pilin Flp
MEGGRNTAALVPCFECDTEGNPYQGDPQAMKNFIVSFVCDEQGQDLIEYALLLGLISVVCIVSIQGAGQKVSYVWSFLDSALGTVPGVGS